MQIGIADRAAVSADGHRNRLMLETGSTDRRLMTAAAPFTVNRLYVLRFRMSREEQQDQSGDGEWISHAFPAVCEPTNIGPHSLGSHQRPFGS